jgi:hypothetical protein
MTTARQLGRVWAAIFALGGATALHAQTYNIAEYFPIPHNSTWYYVDLVPQPAGDSDAFTWTVLGAELSVGTGLSAIQLKTTTDEASDARNNDIDYWRQDPGGDLQLWGSYINSLPGTLPKNIVLTSPLVAGKAGMTVGQVINDTSRYTFGTWPLQATVTFALTTKLVAVLPSLTTSLGTFSNVIKLRMNFEVRDVPIVGTYPIRDSFMYLAKNVGLVRQTQGADADDATDQVLASGKINNVTIVPTGVVNHTVRFTAGDNGTLSGSAMQTVPHGGSASAVTANPDPGYRFVRWTSGGNLFSTNRELTVTNVTADLTLNAEFAAKQAQTISFTQPPPKTYGDAPFALSATASSGLTVSVASDNAAVATVSGFTVTVKGAGTCNLTASQAGDTDWSAAPNVIHALTVAKAALTVTADDKSRAYGDPSPLFTLRYAGFVAGEGLAVLDTAPTATCAATAASPVGAYPIVPTGGADANYALTPVNGTLTVNKADQTITFANPGDKVSTDSFALNATGGNSGNPVTFAVTAGPALIGAGNMLSFTGIGPVTITASQAGNVNFNAATAVPRTFTVSKATPTLTWPTPAAITQGTALGAAKLNATANIAGSFVYAPPAGSVLAVGTHTLAVSFTPDDTARWANAAAERSLVVVAATPPVITNLAPPDNALGVALDAPLVLTFSTAMVAGSGDIHIMNAAGTEFERIPVSGRGAVNIAGQTVTITHAPWVPGNAYYVLIAPTCLKDLAGQAFAGIDSPSAWNFTAVVRPWVVQFAANTGGTLLGNTRQEIANGGSATPVTAVPAYGYVFTRWERENDGLTVMTAALAPTPVTADARWTASFRSATTIMPPSGVFTAVTEGDAVASGLGLWDLSGTYTTSAADKPLVLRLLHDAKGRLTGTATYTTAKAAPLNVPIRGSVRGSGGGVVATIALQGADATGATSVSLTLDLTVNVGTRRLAGTMAGNVTVDGVPHTVSANLSLPIALPMNGAWTLRFDLLQRPRSITGTALLTLSNGAHCAYLVNGKKVGTTAVLSLVGDATDPLSRASKIRAIITPLEGGWARLESFSDRSYGQSLFH